MQKVLTIYKILFTTMAIQNPNQIHLIYDINLIPTQQETDDRNTDVLVKGEKYTLSGVSCDGFEMPKRLMSILVMLKSLRVIQ